MPRFRARPPFGASGPAATQLAAPLLWVAIALAVAAWVGMLGGTGAGSPIPVQLGALITRAGMDVAGVGCVGLALLVVLLPRAGLLPGAALRPLARARSYAGRALAGLACVWFVLVVVGIVFRAADAFGESLGTLGADRLFAWSTRLAAGRGLLLAAACAAAVAVCAVIRMRSPERIQNRLPLVIALFGVLTPGVTGHSGSSIDHQLAVITVALHSAAAALWVGGLAAVLALTAANRPLLDGVLPRFSRLAGGCLIVVALTGVVNALLHTGSLTALFDTRYGWLVLAKTALLVLIAALGGLTRRRLRAGLLPVLRWAGIEVVLMAATIGVAAALSQSG